MQTGQWNLSRKGEGGTCYLTRHMVQHQVDQYLHYRVSEGGEREKGDRQLI